MLTECPICKFRGEGMDFLNHFLNQHPTEARQFTLHDDASDTIETWWDKVRLGLIAPEEDDDDSEYSCGC